MSYKYIDVNKIWLDKNDFFQFLDKTGKLKDKNFKSSFSQQEIIIAYEWMVLSRQQDTYMSQLQRQGRLLTFAPNFGEEALQVAVGLALKKEDWFVPAFRSNAIMLIKGVPLENQILYWNGNEVGSKMPQDVNVLPINIPIATQFSHANGIAYALKQQKSKAITLTFIGDGGTSEGEFYEAMNLANVHNWPVVFCINNNQWAISTPLSEQTKAKTLAIKAMAAGIPSLRVDGNDLLASYEIISEAIKWTRENNGPILVEFLTWRQGPHTTSDNPKIYRTEQQEKDAEEWEPMKRIKNYLISLKIWDEIKDKQLWDKQLDKVKQAYQKILTIKSVSIDDVFDHTFAKLTPELVKQKAIAKKQQTSEENK